MLDSSACNKRLNFLSFLRPDTDTSLVEVVAGYNTSLPCAIQSPLHDAPVLTLWYIGADDTPVYRWVWAPDCRASGNGSSRPYATLRLV